jgi:N-methylhydantoinase B/oxoprolinase/acetone carboxylase alpha subunit
VGESTWTVSVSHGSKKQGKPTEVTSDRVARAMHTLGDDAAIMAVDAVIESARAAAQKRIEELSNELEAARAVLAHLDG